MWLRRIRLRLSPKTKKPEFRDIKWNDDDDGEVRPVTRGKEKQFGFEELSPTMPMKGEKDTAAYRMRSNVSYSSLAALTGSDTPLLGTSNKHEITKRSEGHAGWSHGRYYVSYGKGPQRLILFQYPPGQ